MAHKLTWHGHANFQIATVGANILIDPFFEGNPSASTSAREIEKPDLVLLTHDHPDHVGQAAEICIQTGAALGAVVGTAEKFVEMGVPAGQIINGIGFNIGGSIEFKGVTVTMTQAYHTSESGCPVGYIVTLEDGYTLYHSGDTGVFTDMALWGDLYPMDLALLPIGGVFTMDPRQAAVACRLLGCRRVAPMHWGTFPVLESGTEVFGRELVESAPDTELLQLLPGQTVELKK